jgi:UDPglucose--hexose-1-phosphate uridylyltransferase
MPEIRQNMATKEWVIISTERAKRPDQFVKTGEKQTADRPALNPDCPFCPGNEAKTPPELFRIEHNGTWSVRVIPNKFAALSSVGEPDRVYDGVRREINGVGHHEVILETPFHNKTLGLLSPGEATDVVTTYRERYLNAVSDPRVQLVILFKNHGDAAGTSLEHPHSQMIATPIVPSQIRHRLQDALVFSDDHGACVYCTMQKEELKMKERIVVESEHFVAFVLYAAASPFHVWITPRRHMACFSSINDAEVADLAGTLQGMLARYYIGLSDPSFNLVIRSAPVGMCDSKHFHWYLSIVPRLSKAAGFELGSGMFINASIPEESAAFLRGVKV